MNSHETALEAAAKAYAVATGYYVPFHAGLSSDSANSIRKGVSSAISAYISTLSPDVSGLVERLRVWAAGSGACLDAANADDFTAIADALASLSLQLAAVEGERDAARKAHRETLDLLSIRNDKMNAAEASLSAAQEENERLRAKIENALSAMNRCEHDGGFDREIGPIGCDLGDKCVCIGVYPALASASTSSECCGKPVHDGDPDGYVLECCGKYLSTPSKEDKTDDL